MVHASRIGGLGADFDGDMITVNFLFGKKAVDQIFDYFKTIAAYINPLGGFKAPISTLITDLVMNSITGDPEWE
jgi:hypothetical protein